MEVVIKPDADRREDDWRSVKVERFDVWPRGEDWESGSGKGDLLILVQEMSGPPAGPAPQLLTAAAARRPAGLPLPKWGRQALSNLWKACRLGWVVPARFQWFTSKTSQLSAQGQRDALVCFWLAGKSWQAKPAERRGPHLALLLQDSCQCGVSCQLETAVELSPTFVPSNWI